MDGGLRVLMELLDDDVISSSFYEASLKRKKRRRIILQDIVKQNERRKIPKNKNYLKVVELYPNDVFKAHFRMERQSFEKLIKVIKPFWQKKNFGPKISLKMALFITLYKLANRATFRETSDRFGVAKGAAFKYFIRTIKILYNMQHTYIKWPNTELEQKKIMENFQNLRPNPVPMVLGCVDGTHIPITRPLDDKISYFNRKAFYSINVQAICDSSLKFIDVFVGMPGSCHDAHVWKQSPIGKSLAEGEKHIVQDGYLLGDSAYALSPYLITPYRDNGFLTRAQKQFNIFHSSTRVCIEQAFGRLKGKFRILKGFEVKNMTYIKYIITSCFVLHNFIIENENEHVSEESPSTIEEEINFPEVEANATTEGIAKRNRLAALFES